MRKSSTSRKSSLNPVRISMFSGEDKSAGRSDARRTQIPKAKEQLSIDNSQIARPRIRSSSSDRSSIRPSNLKAPVYSGKTPLRQQQLSNIRVSTATTPIRSQITPRERSQHELPSGSRHRSPSAERASGFGAKGPRKDTRPLADKSYQTTMLNKIDMFFYNIQQTSMLNPNGSLKPITLKIFVEVTGCLVNLLDVKHQLTIGNYMDELPKIAKKLHYPGTITKSWLKTANTMHSWPQVLGWLSWLVEVCEAKDIAAATFEIDKLPFLDTNGGVDMNRNNFLAMIHCYGAWNANKTAEEAAMIEEHVRNINNQHGDIEKTLQEAKENIENEQAGIQGVNQQLSDIDEEVNDLREYLNTLKNEESKDLDSMNSLEHTIEKEIQETERLNNDVNILEGDIARNRTQQEELNILVEKQPMSVKERDGIVQKCSEIKKSIQQFDNHVNDIEKELYAMDLKFSASNSKLYKAILAYNKDIIMHLGGDTGADLEELKMPETNMLSADFLDLLRTKEAAMLNLKENMRKQLGQTRSIIETSNSELESLKDKLKALREENKDHVAKMDEQKICIQEFQRRAKNNEDMLKKQMKTIKSDIIQLEQSMPDVESSTNELAEAQDKFEAIKRRSEAGEKRAERFFEQFYKILAEHRNEIADTLKKLSLK